MNTYKPWGQSLSIDLFDCDLETISSPEKIGQYVQQVIKEIDMVAHGPCYIERFGEGNLEGYSAMQFIETSSITIHCDEPDRRAFIDIFSCKEIPVEKALGFTKNFFSAGRAQHTVLNR